VKTARDVLAAVIESLAARDATFLARLSMEQARTRHVIGRSPEALYSGSPHLAVYARKIRDGWFMATNCSKRDVARAVMLACKVANVRYGREISTPFA
jgi:hypothetical protein